MRDSEDMATTDNTSPKTPAKPATRKRAPAKKAATNGKAATLAKAKETARPLREEADNMVSKLKTSAREAAETGKEKTTSALDEVTAMVEDVARTIDEKAGPKYGSYAHRAADAISGLSETLKTKQLDELIDDARDFVRKRPAVAIGAAAALGFALTRLFRADADDQNDA
jgi:ElaB/YqjD/DUF883 family membrane-anchored ribosome-binding protein